MYIKSFGERFCRTDLKNTTMVIEGVRTARMWFTCPKRYINKTSSTRRFCRSRRRIFCEDFSPSCLDRGVLPSMPNRKTMFFSFDTGFFCWWVQLSNGKLFLTKWSGGENFISKKILEVFLDSFPSTSYFQLDLLKMLGKKLKQILPNGSLIVIDHGPWCKIYTLED